MCLLDQHLPDMLGTQLRAQLSKLATCQNATFAAVTGEVGDDDVARLLDEGFDLHVPKPVQLSALDALIRSVSAA